MDPKPLYCNYGSLDDGSITLDSTHYTVGAVRWEGLNALLPELHLQLDADFPTADLPFLTFRVGSYSLALADADRSTAETSDIDNNYRWPVPEGFPELGAGAQVTVQLSAELSADATLSGLALADDEGTAVALNEAFVPGETIYTAYTASVANPVGQVTVTPATRGPNATVEYLDGDGNPLADADAGTDGQQVALDVGDTVIGVRVTAQDGTTRTYTVTVTRAAYACAAPDLSDRIEVWTGTLTVGALSRFYGYLPGNQLQYGRIVRHHVQYHLGQLHD